MNRFRHYYSFNSVLLLNLYVALIASAFKFSNIIRNDTTDLQQECNIFFLLFALVWWIVSGFNNFIFRIHGFFPCERRLSNVINAFIMHAFILACCIVMFNLDELSRLLLLYTYLSTVLLLVYLYVTKPDGAHTRYVIVGTGPAATRPDGTLQR